MFEFFKFFFGIVDKMFAFLKILRHSTLIQSSLYNDHKKISNISSYDLLLQAFKVQCIM